MGLAQLAQSPRVKAFVPTAPAGRGAAYRPEFTYKPWHFVVRRCADPQLTRGPHPAHSFPGKGSTRPVQARDGPSPGPTLDSKAPSSLPAVTLPVPGWPSSFVQSASACAPLTLEGQQPSPPASSLPYSTCVCWSTHACLPSLWHLCSRVPSPSTVLAHRTHHTCWAGPRGPPCFFPWEDKVGAPWQHFQAQRQPQPGGPHTGFLPTPPSLCSFRQVPLRP